MATTLRPAGGLEIIGTYEVPADETFRKLCEFAAWWTDILVPAGRYPVVLSRSSYGSGEPYIVVRLTGTVTAAYSQAHFGGVPVGSDDRQFDRHRDVGRRDEYTILTDAYALGRIMAAQAGDVRFFPKDYGHGTAADWARIRRWSISRAFSYDVTSFISRWPVSHIIVPEPGRFISGRGIATSWSHVATLVRTRALPAPRPAAGVAA